MFIQTSWGNKKRAYELVVITFLQRSLRPLSKAEKPREPHFLRAVPAQTAPKFCAGCTVFTNGRLLAAHPAREARGQFPRSRTSRSPSLRGWTAQSSRGTVRQQNKRRQRRQRGPYRPGRDRHGAPGSTAPAGVSVRGPTARGPGRQTRQGRKEPPPEPDGGLRPTRPGRPQAPPASKGKPLLSYLGRPGFAEAVLSSGSVAKRCPSGHCRKDSSPPGAPQRPPSLVRGLGGAGPGTTPAHPAPPTNLRCFPRRGLRPALRPEAEAAHFRGGAAAARPGRAAPRFGAPRNRQSPARAQPRRRGPVIATESADPPSLEGAARGSARVWRRLAPSSVRLLHPGRPSVASGLRAEPGNRDLGLESRHPLLCAGPCPFRGSTGRAGAVDPGLVAASWIKRPFCPGQRRRPLRVCSRGWDMHAHNDFFFF